MVALLIVLMFAIFIAADYMFNREKYRLPVSATAPVLRPPVSSLAVEASQTDLQFHPAHTWAAFEGSDTARIGLDAFAARVLPTPSRLDVPLLDRWVAQGARAFTLRYGNKEVTLLSPVDGQVVEVNREALADPSLLKSDPYGKGWLLKLRSPDMDVSKRNLLGPVLVQSWMDDSLLRLRQFFAPTALVTAQDGGVVVDSLAATLDAEQWKRFTGEFFRS